MKNVGGYLGMTIVTFNQMIIRKVPPSATHRCVHFKPSRSLNVRSGDSKPLRRSCQSQINGVVTADSSKKRCFIHGKRRWGHRCQFRSHNTTDTRCHDEVHLGSAHLLPAKVGRVSGDRMSADVKRQERAQDEHGVDCPC